MARCICCHTLMLATCRFVFGWRDCDVAMKIVPLNGTLCVRLIHMRQLVIWLNWSLQSDHADPARPLLHAQLPFLWFSPNHPHSVLKLCFPITLAGNADRQDRNRETYDALRTIFQVLNKCWASILTTSSLPWICRCGLALCWRRHKLLTKSELRTDCGNEGVFVCGSEWRDEGTEISIEILCVLNDGCVGSWSDTSFS